MRLAWLASVMGACSQPVTVIVGDKALGSVPEDFLSYTIDSSSAFAKKKDSPDRKVLDDSVAALAAELSPAIVRVGGTQSDFNWYYLGSEHCDSLPDIGPPHKGNRSRCVTANELDDVANWATKAKAKLTLGLSIGYPKGKVAESGGSLVPWDPSNAYSVLDYFKSKGLPLQFVEVGNEVNEQSVKKDASFQISAAKTMAKHLSQDGKVQLLGPDTHSPTLRATEEFFKYAEDYISQTCAEKTVAAYTYHSYIDRFDVLTVEGLDEQHKESSRFVDAVKRLCPSNPRVIAGEIGLHNGGGAAGTTDTFKSTFWYLDALGATATMLHESFFRQTLLAKENGILDMDGTPRADYWAAVLHKRLMGTTVLDVKSSSPLLRLYAHCSKAGSGDMTMMFININNATSQLSLSGLKPKAVQSYVLTGELSSPSVQLNGKQPGLSGGQLPTLDGQSEADPNLVTLPGPSVGFLLVSGAQAAACASTIDLLV